MMDINNVIRNWNMTETVSLPWSRSPSMEPPMRDTWTWVLSISLFVTAILTLLGNGFVLIVFFVEKNLLKSHFNIFLVNLTMTDIAISVTAIPLYGINYFFGKWPDILGPELCAIWVFCDWGMTFASVYTLMAISIDRYWAVCWSHHYRTLDTRRRTLLMVAATWMLVLLVWVPAFIADQLDEDNSADKECMWSIEKNEKFSIFMAVAGYHVPSCVILFCYVRLYISMRQSRHKVLKKHRGRANPDEARHLKSISALTLDSSTSINDQIVLGNMEQHQSDLKRDINSCLETETIFCDVDINGHKTSPNPPGIHQYTREIKALPKLPEDSNLAVPQQETRKSSISLEVPTTIPQVADIRVPTRPRSFTYGATREHVFQKKDDHHRHGSLNRTRHRSTPPFRSTPPDSTGSHGTDAKFSRAIYLSRQRRDYKLFKRISYIIVMYLFLWLPFHVVFDLMLAGVEVPETWYTIATLMCYFNSTINPVLYALGNPKMREAFKSILSCRKD